MACFETSYPVRLSECPHEGESTEAKECYTVRITVKLSGQYVYATGLKDQIVVITTVESTLR